MQSYIVKYKRLKPGIKKITGYKHASNLIICAALAIDDRIKITNVGDIQDTRALISIINFIGGECKTLHPNELILNGNNISNHIIPEDYSKLSHAAIYLFPVILGKLRRVCIGETGGCQIGDKKHNRARPVEHIISVMEKFGAHVFVEKSKLYATIDDFIPATIDIFDYSDFDDILTGQYISGATKTAILMSLFVERGLTVINNPYSKPDVIELLEFITKCGYKVHLNPNQIIIEYGNKKLNSIVIYNIIEDISVLMTYITLAIYHNIDFFFPLLSVSKIRKGLLSEFHVLEKMGINIIWTKNGLYIPKNQSIKNIDIIVTSLGIYSDHQPFFALLLSKASGISSITELVWKERFDYALELNKLFGSTVYKINDNMLTIIPNNLDNSHNPNKVIAKDLRSAAVLLIASLGVNAPITLEGVEHLKRGYENFIEDLNQMGAFIKKA